MECTWIILDKNNMKGIIINENNNYRGSESEHSIIWAMKNIADYRSDR